LDGILGGDKKMFGFEVKKPEDFMLNFERVEFWGDLAFFWHVICFSFLHKIEFFLVLEFLNLFF
jgi:hypothetical protein